MIMNDQYAADTEQDDEEPGEARLTYVQLMQAENIVTLLPKEDLDEIAAKVISEFDLDYTSLNEWRKKNEASIKLARQYFIERGEPKRARFIARRQSYHGNTLGALSGMGVALAAESEHRDLAALDDRQVGVVVVEHLDGLAVV